MPARRSLLPGVSASDLNRCAGGAGEGLVGARVIVFVALLGLLAVSSIVSIRSRLPEPVRDYHPVYRYELGDRHIVLTMEAPPATGRRASADGDVKLSLADAAARIHERGTGGVAAARGGDRQPATAGGDSDGPISSWLKSLSPRRENLDDAAPRAAFREMGSVDDILAHELLDWREAASERGREGEPASAAAARESVRWFAGGTVDHSICERMRHLANGVDSDHAILERVVGNGSAVMDSLIDELVRLLATTRVMSDAPEPGFFTDEQAPRLPDMMARQRREGLLTFVPTGERAWRAALATRFLNWQADTGVHFYATNYELALSTMEEHFLGPALHRLWAEYGTEAFWVWLLFESNKGAPLTIDRVSEAVRRLDAPAESKDRLLSELKLLDAAAGKAKRLVEIDEHVLGAWMFHKMSDYTGPTEPGPAAQSSDAFWMPTTLHAELSESTRNAGRIQEELLSLVGLPGGTSADLQQARTACAVTWALDLFYAYNGARKGIINRHVAQYRPTKLKGGEVDLRLLLVNNKEDVLHAYVWGPIAYVPYRRRLEGDEENVYRPSMDMAELLSSIDVTGGLCRLSTTSLSLMHCGHGAGHGIYHALTAAASVESVYYWGNWAIEQMPLVAPTIDALLDTFESVPSADTRGAPAPPGAREPGDLLDENSIGDLSVLSPISLLACERFAAAVLNSSTAVEHFGTYDMMTMNCLSGVYHSIFIGAGKPHHSFATNRSEAYETYVHDTFTSIAQTSPAIPPGSKVPAIQSVILGLLLDPINMRSLPNDGRLVDMASGEGTEHLINHAFSWSLLFLFASLNLCAQQSERHLELLLLSRTASSGGTEGEGAMGGGGGGGVDGGARRYSRVLGPMRRATEACYWSWGRISMNMFQDPWKPDNAISSNGMPLEYTSGFAFRLASFPGSPGEDEAGLGLGTGEVIHDAVDAAERLISSYRSGRPSRLELLLPQFDIEEGSKVSPTPPEPTVAGDGGTQSRRDRRRRASAAGPETVGRQRPKRKRRKLAKAFEDEGRLRITRLFKGPDAVVDGSWNGHREDSGGGREIASERIDRLLQQPIVVTGRGSVLAATCGVLGDSYCEGRCGGTDGEDDCLQECLRVARDSVRPWCWGGVGSAVYSTAGNAICDGREYVTWGRAEDGKTEVARGTSALMDFHVSVFEMNQCFTLCDLHGCSRRDFESCVAGYLVEFGQRVDKLKRFRGFCTAIADTFLRRACELMDGFLDELDEDDQQRGTTRRIRAFSVAGILIDELGDFGERWRNATVPARMMTCIDAIESAPLERVREAGR